MFRLGRTVGDRNLILFVLPLGSVPPEGADAPPAGVTRVGVAAARSAGSAVKRNRIRRRLRALLQEIGPPEVPLQLVVLGKARVLEAPWPELVRSGRTLLARASRLARNRGG